MQFKFKISNLLLLKFACYTSLAISLLPVIDYYCPWYVTAIPVLIVLFVTIILQKDNNIYPLLPAFLLIVCFAILQYWIVNRSASAINHFINFVIAFIPCLVAIQINKKVNNKKFFRNYLKCAAFFTGITSITTIIGLNVFPMASRELASGTAIYDTTQYTIANIGGYEYICSLIIFVPILLYLIKNSKGALKVFYLVVLVLNICCIYESQYTIALICAVISFFVVWMQLNRRVAGVVLCVLTLFFIFNGLSVLSDIFRWASEAIGQEYVADRLLQVSQLLSGGSVHTNTSNVRIEHYMNQLTAFSKSPIWGHNWICFKENYISGHSVILDILGGAGLLGAIAMFTINRKLYLFALNPGKRNASPYIKAVWIMLIVVSLLNPVIFPNVATIVFMCCMCIQKLEVGGG